MSRYDKLSTKQLKKGVTAMAGIAKGYGETRWQVGQDQMHDEINQVLTELESRRKNQE